ncbi:MAG: acyl carrier protein [Gemmatimonadota bacterium]|nr:acyl carrier protein [Gemmatimonadota bacterium]
MSEIQSTVKSYVLEEFLPGESPDAMDNSTPLISSGILDSLSTIKLVSFLEEQFNVQFEAHEISRENLDTLDLIAATVESKRHG